MTEELNESTEPKKRRGRKPHAEQGVTLTAESLRDLLTEVIREAKKPTEMEQRKIDEDNAKRLRREFNLVKEVQRSEERKKAGQLGCSHITVHPTSGLESHAWRAQVHSPEGEEPYFIPTCTICMAQLPKIKAQPQMMTQGVQLDQYKRITKDQLLEWGKKSWEKAKSA